MYTVAALDRSGRVTTQSGIDVEDVRERRKGGDQELPDLVPVPDEYGSYCRQRDGKLVVTVRNQGAGRRTLRYQVDFFDHGQLSPPTPPLAPNASAELLFDIPPGCADPDCEFRITVDVDGEVVEASESNNTVYGICEG